MLGLSAGAISFLYLIFVLNPIQMLSVLIYPFSRSAFREINRWCARSIWGLWVLMAEVQNRIQFRFTGDVVPRRENALVIPNHQSMADVMVLICFAWRCARVGDMKWFVKDIIKYVPGPGWGMRFLDCVFVKRDWDRDRAGIERLFGKYKAESIPLFLVSFLEGTRRTPEKQAQAQAFARERGLPPPEHTLVPRTKGFVASVLGLRDHLDAVYDLTIAYPRDAEGKVPTLASCFAAAFPRVDVHVRRFPLESLPSEEAALAEWAHARFREKEELLSAFARDGRFPGPERPSRVRVLDWFRSEARRSTEVPAGAPDSA